MAKNLTLILGGAGAGKSALAERMAAQAGKQVLFVATAEAGDAEMTERIRKHKAARPAHWRTLEEPLNVRDAIQRDTAPSDVVLLDCLTLWVSNLLLKYEHEKTAQEQITQQAQDLLAFIGRDKRTWFVVSNEVGMGVVPEHPLGRAYRDALGKVNQLFAAQAGSVQLVIAGLAWDLKASSIRPLEHNSGG